MCIMKSIRKTTTDPLSNRLRVFNKLPVASLLFVFSFFTQGCAGRPEDSMMSQKKVDFVQLNPATQFTWSEMDSSLMLEDDLSVGPKGYWIRSENGLSRLGNHINRDAVGSPIAAWTQKDWVAHDLFQVSIGVQGTTGHSIQILGVEEIGDTVRISLKHLIPSGMVGEALTHPSATLVTQKWPSGKKFELWIDGKKAACQWHELN
jgi:hypothetical protein